MDVELLKQKIDKGIIQSDHLLACCKFFDENSRRSPEFQDPTYLPVYFYLGQQLSNVKSVLQIGSKLGLPSACFLQGCPTVQNWTFAFEKKSSIITSNLRRFSDLDIRFQSENFDSKFDLTILTEKRLFFDDAEFLWDNLAIDGWLVVDCLRENDWFLEFGEIKNRDLVHFNTRYGLGMIQR